MALHELNVGVQATRADDADLVSEDVYLHRLVEEHGLKGTMPQGVDQQLASEHLGLFGIGMAWGQHLDQGARQVREQLSCGTDVGRGAGGCGCAVEDFRAAGGVAVLPDEQAGRGRGPKATEGYGASDGELARRREDEGGAEGGPGGRAAPGYMGGEIPVRSTREGGEIVRLGHLRYRGSNLPINKIRKDVRSPFWNWRWKDLFSLG